LTISKQNYEAVIFDLDGVVTKTARIHAAVWKKLFDKYLKERAAREGEQFQPFDIATDYPLYLNGKPRYEGVRSFLRSRGIELPYGNLDDPWDKETICGLGNRKNLLFHEELKKQGVEVYSSAVDFIRDLRSKDFKTAIVSSSKNCVAVLEAAKLVHLFDAKVDGVDREELGLEGKPSPDVYLEAARRLNVTPERAIIVEDSIAGVQAGRQGHFGCVIGVNRNNNGANLKKNGADIVLKDLSEVGVGEELPSALDGIGEIVRDAKEKRVVIFLDYDGTLTPIVETPDQAVLSDQMRHTLQELAGKSTVAVISGRDLRDVQERVGIPGIFYAGSHGFDIAGPEGHHLEYRQGMEFLPLLDQAEKSLQDRLGSISGALIERKKFSVAVHYRKVREEEIGQVEKAVDHVVASEPRLRKTHGKKVFEIQPNIDWHKGKAVTWLLEALSLDRPEVLPLYIGDDITDEDAFNALRQRGIGILVGKSTSNTAARYRLKNTEEVERLLKELMSVLPGGTR
jgi:trehalose-phosphatase